MHEKHASVTTHAHKIHREVPSIQARTKIAEHSIIKGYNYYVSS